MASRNADALSRLHITIVRSKIMSRGIDSMANYNVRTDKSALDFGGDQGSEGRQSCPDYEDQTFVETAFYYGGFLQCRCISWNVLF